MKSNYKIGEIVEEIEIRNTANDVEVLLGLSINKCFIKSVANTIGTDLKKYKVIFKDDFAVSLMQVSRDDKIPIACLQEYNKAIVSPAYHIFRIKNKNVICPEYLEILFRRSEFDREAAYIAVGGVRGSMPWSEFCRINLSIPSIEKQLEIVHQYKVISDRIALKQKINDTLEEILKLFFKERFININSKNKICLGDVCNVTKGTTPTTLGRKFSESGINFIKVENININHSFDKDSISHIDLDTNELLKRSQIKLNDILFTIAGTIGKFAIVSENILPANTNQAIAIIRVNEEIISPKVLYSYFIADWHKEFYTRKIQQSVQANLSLSTIKELPLFIPNEELLWKYEKQITPLIDMILDNQYEIIILNELQKIILSQVSK